MHGETDNAAFVAAWFTRTVIEPSGPQRVDLVDRALAALWRRATVTLGEITLWAIANRVVRIGRQAYPLLSAVKVEPSGFNLKAVRDDPTLSGHDDCAPAMSLLLVELLTVIGRLTGEILSPELRDELSRVPRSEPSAGDASASRPATDKRKSKRQSNGE